MRWRRLIASSGILWATVGTTFGTEATPAQPIPALERSQPTTLPSTHWTEAGERSSIAHPTPMRGMFFPATELPTTLRLERDPLVPLTLHLPVREQPAPVEPTPAGRSI